MMLLSLLISISPSQVEWNLPRDLAVVSVKPTRRVKLKRGVRGRAEWRRQARIGTQTVKIRVPGRRPISAYVEVRALALVPVAVTDLAEGEIVDTRSVRFVRRPVAEEPNHRILMGRPLRTAKSAGEIIAEVDVMLPPPVARGTSVKVISRSGPVRITTQGRLARSCRVGESCSVIVPTTRSSLPGQLINKDTFEIGGRS